MNKRLLPLALASAFLATAALSASAQTTPQPTAPPTAPQTDVARDPAAPAGRNDSREANPRHASERDGGSASGTRDRDTDTTAPMDRTPASTDPDNRGATGAALPPTGGTTGRAGTEDPTGMQRRTTDFNRWDSDRDEFLSRQELDANRSWTGDNSRLDRDGDGRISRDEWDRYQRDHGAGNDPVHPSLRNEDDDDRRRDDR